MGTDPQDDGVETAMLQQVLGGTKNHSIQGAILLTKELKTQQGSYAEATCQIT